MKNNRTGLIILIVVGIVLICCICIMAAVGISVFLTASSSESNQETTSPDVRVLPKQVAEITDMPLLATRTPSAEESKGEPTLGQPVLSPTNEPKLTTDNTFTEVSDETLKILEDTLVPINDLLDIAKRLTGKDSIPRTVDAPAKPYQIGDERTFWVTNVDTNRNFQTDATLAYITDHTYFWVGEGVQYEQDDLSLLAETFENEIYPTNREFFGSEWTPGVDNDPRIYILYTSDLGFNLAGYFSSADEFHPQAHEYSNAVELFLLNSDTIGLDEPFTYGVLAHEFQHMIHWYQDRNEGSWLNEGFSELAAFLNGYYESGFDWLYINDPDLQLNDWPNDSNSTTPHYGAGFLYVAYFLDRFGEEATRALVSSPENGLTSVDIVLDELGFEHPSNGSVLTADDVFIDWVVANYVQDASVGDGQFAYYTYTAVPQPFPVEYFEECPVNQETYSVSQFGVDYLQFSCQGEYNIRIQGTPQVKVIPGEPYSGSKAFWSNKGDESDMTLTHEFDFTGHSGKLTLSYWTWYDLEEDYDYLYVLASVDGEKWEILNVPSGTDEDPSGNSYGWSYNGISGTGSDADWIHETVDLSKYAGKAIQIRFEYITDAAVNGEGLLLDDISIPEINYFSDFEKDDGGWEPQGWVRIRNELPQTYRLALITYGDTVNVEQYSLIGDQVLEIPLRLTDRLDEAILVVTGTTRFTRQEALYFLEVTP